MSISNLHPLVILATVGPWIVGATFLWAGFVKAISPHVFEAHLHKLAWIPPRQVPNSVTMAAALEAGWGAALILGVAPAIVLPITAVALVVLTTISWWGIQSGRTTDCGCYGGYVVPSLAQSIALNATFVALVLIAWLVQSGSATTPQWKVIAALATAIVAGSLAVASAQFLKKHGRFMMDLSPLKIGRAWRARWGATIPDAAEHIVSFLGPECPHCKHWVRVLNVIDKTPGLPRVMGVVATSSDKLDEFVTTSGIQFPMHTIPQTLMSRLVWGVPTTVLVANGTIQNQWTGQMSPEFFQRFRDAFFPTARPEVTQQPDLLST